MKRIKTITLTILLSVLFIAAHAQGNNEAQKPKIMKFDFGVKAGLNFANISNGSDINFSPAMKTDFHVGILANMHFGYRNEGSPVGTGLFGLQPELIYSRQGFQAGGQSVSLDYITVPIMAKLYPDKRFYIEAGPWGSYLMNVSPSTAAINGEQITISSLKGGMDAGAAFGTGYESKSGLTISARYYYGMSDVANNLQWKNNVISISLGWLF